MNKIFLVIFGLLLFIACSSDENQVVDVIRFPDFMSDVKTDTLYPDLDSLYIHEENNNSYLISKMFLRYDENYRTSMLLYFKSDSLEDLVNAAENRLVLINVGQKDTAFVPFKLNFHYSNQPIDIEEIDDEDFESYFNTSPFYEYDVTDSLSDSLVFANLPLKEEMIYETTDDSGDVAYEMCFSLNTDQSLGGQCYRFTTRYFYLIENTSFATYTPRFVFDKIEESDTTTIKLYCEDNKTMFHYYNTASNYNIPAVLNRYFHLYFDLSKNPDFNEYAMINRAKLSVPYDKEQSESPEFNIGLYAITLKDWRTTEESFKSLVDNNSSYYNTETIDFKMNNYIQNHFLEPDSVHNYGLLLKYYSASTNMGTVALPFNDLNDVDSTQLPKLIINYSVPIENVE